MVNKNNELTKFTTEHENLKKKVEEMEYAVLSDEEEIEDEKSLLTQAQLIVKIRELNQDCMATPDAGFTRAVE